MNKKISSKSLMFLTIISLISMFSYLTILFINSILNCIALPIKPFYSNVVCEFGFMDNPLLILILLVIFTIGIILGIIVVVHPNSTANIRTMMIVAIILAIFLQPILKTTAFKNSIQKVIYQRNGGLGVMEMVNSNPLRRQLLIIQNMFMQQIQTTTESRNLTQMVVI